MPNSVNRRHFLCQAASVATGVGVLTQTSLPCAQAIEPIARTGGSFFKYALAAYSYRDLFKAKHESERLTLEDFINDCALLNLQGTELTSYYFPKDPTPEYLREIKRQCYLLGLEVSGTAVGNDFCLPEGEARQQQIAHVKRWVDHAAILGAPVIRIFSGDARGTTVEEAHRLAIAAIEECCDYAGKQGVVLALENHGGLTATAEGMLNLVRSINSPWFGVNLDTGNFNSEDPYAELEQLAPYAVNVQVKVSMHRHGHPRERADFSRLAKIVRNANYRGYIVLEFEDPEPPRDACKKYVAEMREAFEA